MSTHPNHQEPEAPFLPNQESQELSKDEEKDLDKALKHLDFILFLLGFNQSSPLRFGLSWAAFLVIGVALPVVVLSISNCLDCDKYQVKNFELLIVSSQACLAGVSLLCVSHNLRKYGVRKFLFVDQHSGQMERFEDGYVRKVKDYDRLLALLILPCFILKIVREVIRIVFVRDEPLWQSCAILLALVVSWTYVTTVFLAACLVFYLVCNLQIIHFDDYGKLLERESDCLVFIEEHVLLRHHLSKISHRFRIYLVLEFVTVTITQVATLFQIQEYQGTITAINGGDFAIASVAQVVGICLCLNAAAKISHRAQGIASIASRWHAIASCTTDGSQLRFSNSVGNLSSYSSGSDLDLMNYIPVPMNTNMNSYMSLYLKRQAFVLYLQNNPGGITIFGYTVDRGLINTIFLMELSLVLFVFGRTTIFTISE